MKIKYLAVTAALVMLLSGCSEQAAEGQAAQSRQISEQNEIELQPYTIEGIAMPCTNGIIFILSDHNGGYSELSPISMSAADNDSSIFDGLAAGDKIKAEITLVEETYPAHTYVYSLEKTGSGSTDDIPADLIARLKEMGYTAVEDRSAM